MGVEGVIGRLDGVPEGNDDGVVVSQLVHVGLVDVQGGDEGCRSWRQSPQSWLPR